jgi:hypothetical protein
MGKLKKLSDAQLKKLSPSELKAYVEKHERAAQKEAKKKADLAKAMKFKK